MTCCPKVIDEGLHIFWKNSKNKKFVNEILITPQNFEPIQKKKRKSSECDDCGKVFEEKVLIHLCARCDNSVCEDCAKKFHEQMITKNDFGAIVICNTCVYELEHLIEHKTHPSDTIFNHYGHSKVHILQRGRKNHEFLPSAGFLYVRVLRGHNFPQMDVWPFSCDTYITFGLVYGLETKDRDAPYTTNVQWNNIEPRWDSGTVIPIKNSTGHLEMNIWDHDTFSAHDQLWNCHIPLQDLTHGQLVQYDCPIPDFEDCVYTFQLKYVVDPVADMVSRFDTIEYYPTIPKDFDLNDFLDAIFDFVFFLQYILIRPIQSFVSIITWESYTGSIIGVIIAHMCMETPNMILFWIQVGFLYAILDNKFHYASDHEARAEKRDYHGDQDLAEMDMMSRKKETHSDISGASIVNSLICMAGSDATLNWITELLEFMTDGMRNFCDTLNYSDIGQTRSIVRVLIMSSAVSLLLSKFSWYYLYYLIVMFAMIIFCPFVFNSFCVILSVGAQISKAKYQVPSFVNVVTDPNDIMICRKIFQLFVINKKEPQKRIELK
jgi:hypothetical protein